MAAEFISQWAKLGIDYDHFIRTSDPKHHETVRWLFERCQKNGYIYKGSYTGQYCVSDELYVNDAKPGDPCPDCGRPTETVTEENYFFKLSRVSGAAARAIRKEPGVREARSPPQRDDRVRQARPERSFHHPNQSPMGHSRSRGRPSRFLRLVRRADLLHERGEGADDLWPADLHLIGKDILRFHAVYWPAFLMAADLPLPKQVFAHGWILHEENKMSKSRGNVVRPGPIVDVVGADALRYFLLREITFGQDGSFSYDALIQRYNSDLANGLGNLASRTLTMIQQYRNGMIPDSPGAPDIAEAARRTTELTLERSAISIFRAAWRRSGLHFGDRQIHRRARALEARQRHHRVRSKAMLDETLYTAAEALRIRLRVGLSGDAEFGSKHLDPARHDDSHRIRNVRRSALGQIAGRPKDRLGGRRLPAPGCERHREDGESRSAGEGAAGGAVRHSQSRRRRRLPRQTARQNRDRRFRESGPARRPGGQRRARERRRQASAHEGGHRRRRSREPSSPASPNRTRRKR